MKNTKIYAEVLENEALSQFYEAMKLECNIQGALMPDAHAGYTLPIGAVIKSKDMIFPSYVGYDIGCGMCAVETNILSDALNDKQLQSIKDLILTVIPVGASRHKHRQKEVQLPSPTKIGKTFFNEIGLYQLGTLGGGNHFIEIGKGESGYVNIIIHSGSRNLGKKIAEYYMKEAAIANIDEQRYINEFDNSHKNQKWFIACEEGKASMDDYLKARNEFVYRRTRARLNTKIEGHYGFNINSQRGQEYISDMNFALEYALENRKLMIERVVKAIEDILACSIKTTRFINRNHNHAEVKDGYVIHRKGATHAENGMYGVIPGNMRDGSFIVKGKGNVDSMSSSSHGAGRVLSRRQAKEKLDINTFFDDMVGIVTNHTDDTLDEAPQAYKNIFEVMELQSDLVDIVERITPIINIKG